jgi:hypothetical protein
LKTYFLVQNLDKLCGVLAFWFIIFGVVWGNLKGIWGKSARFQVFLAKFGQICRNFFGIS